MLEEVRLRHAGTPAQMRFWNSSGKVRAFVGGVGSGKTRAGCVEVLRQPWGSRGVVVAPTYPMLRDATLASFLELAGVLVKDFNKAEMTMTLSTGTEILWRSADNPDSLRGPNLGWCWLDEGAMLPSDETFDILLGRLRLEPGRLWITTTPRGFNWLHRIFVREKRDGYELFNASTRENKFLPHGYLESLIAKYTGSWAQQEVEGEFSEWVAAPCYTFRRETTLVKGLAKTYKPDAPLVVCCDFNVRFMSWPICQVHRGEPRVLTEITQSPATVDRMIEQFRLRFPAHPGEVWFYGDASGNNRTSQTGQSDYDLISTAMRGYASPVTMHVPSKNPPPKDRINAVNRLLRGVDGSPRLKIDADECPELVADLMQVEWNAAGAAETQVNDPHDDRSKRTHSSSGMGYWLWLEWPVGSEVYRKHTAPRPLQVGRLLGAV